MEKKTLKQRIKENSGLKQAVHRFIMHPVKTRPNWWIRIFGYVYLKRGKGSVIYRSVRKDLPPFNRFSLGRYSVVEDFSCLNNAVGDLTIGDYTRIGLRNTIIGPAAIGNHVNLAQNVTVTGLNHNYENVEKRIEPQYDDARSFSNGVAAVKSGNKWGFINESGEMVIKPTFSDAKDFNDSGKVMVKDSGTWQLLKRLIYED